MHPYIHIGSLKLPTYGLIAVCSIAAALICAAIRSHSESRRDPASGVNTEDCMYMFAFAMIGTLVGTKLLYFITVLPAAIADTELFSTDFIAWAARYLLGGFVFYGGLIGGVFGAWLYCRVFHVNIWAYTAAATPSIPLLHAIGRIGCFFGGCCYGMPVGDKWYGVVMQTVPEYGPLLPVQLIESAANFMIFAALLLYTRRSHRASAPLALYFLAYPVVRFTLEFFRYDAVRGSLGGLSTSQWISLPLFALGLVLALWGDKVERFVRFEKKV